MRPMLDDLELPVVQEIAYYDLRMLAEHKPPGMEGSLFQNMGRKPAKIILWGAALGPGALVLAEKLNEKFRAGQPVSFIADIVVDSEIDRVVIEDLQWEELAGKPEQFEYIMTLLEYISPAEPMIIEPPKPVVPVPPVVNIDEDTGTLIIEVVVEGQPDFDYSQMTVTVQGSEEDGTTLSRTLTKRSQNIWTEEDFPAGSYTAKAETTDPEPMIGTAEAKVSAGQTTKVIITLHPAPSNVAKTFVVHFKMDNAFIEPAMCQVLQRVADYAQEHPQEKLIILGHTDLVGSEEYNQNLSERRARSAYAFLTFGRDEAAREKAIKEWDLLRRPGWQRDINDNWGTREYQFMLQNLSTCYYYGNIDGVHGPKTTAAISAFQKDNEIVPTGVMTDETWWALIEEYLDQASLAIPDSQFFRNARGACEGGTLKWLGSGEQDPVRNTQDAWRPNRRTELLFVRGDAIPCEVPKPRTFDKLMPGVAWCLGPDPDLNKQPEAIIKRVDFLSRQGEEPNKWLVQTAEPGKIRVEGTITRDTDDGPGIANAKYVLMAPDGEYLHTDASGHPDLGERPQGEQRGQPIPSKADENGRFSYPEETPAGTYTLEILDIPEPALSKWKGDYSWQAKGNIVFKHMEKNSALIDEAPMDFAEEGKTPGMKMGGVVQPTSQSLPLDNLLEVTAKVLEQLNIIPAYCTIDKKIHPCKGNPRRPGTACRDWAVYPYPAIGPSLYDVNLPDRKETCDDDIINFIESHQPKPLEWLKNWRPRFISKNDVDVVESSSSNPPEKQKLKFAKATEDIDPMCKAYVFERPGNVYPKIISVIWPNELLKDNIDVLPFYIYLHPCPGQDVNYGFFTSDHNLREWDQNIKNKPFYPYGWDFLFFVLWASNNYRRPGFNNDYIVGQAHQIEIAKKPFITVVPMISERYDIFAGDFRDPQMIQKILKEIHLAVASMNNLKSSETRHAVAIGAFSDGNSQLIEILNKKNHPFMQDELREVYIFDPPPHLSGVIYKAMEWAKDDEKNVVRVYTARDYGRYKLTGDNKPENGFMVFHPNNPFRSYALLEHSFWAKFLPSGLFDPSKIEETVIAHSLIPSTMLVDAIRRNGI